MTAVPKESSSLRWYESSPISPLTGDPSTVWEDQGHFSQSLHPRDWLQNVLREIHKLRELRINWDSYGADPVHAGAIWNAVQIVVQISRFIRIEAPDVSATPDGTVALGWDVGDWSLDVEIQPDGKIVFAYLDRTNGAQNQSGVLSDWQRLASLLCRAFSSRRKK